MEGKEIFSLCALRDLCGEKSFTELGILTGGKYLPLNDD
jgi:hypothetical protein